jgi:outer membrane protein OmpA-like peptidoglycan-associated protein
MLHRTPRTLWIAASALCIPIVSGCATKAYVRDRVAELGTTVGTEQQNLRTDLDRTGRTASDASARADAAGSEASRARLLALGNVDYRTASTYEVRFGFDQADLSQDALQTLDLAVGALQESPRYVVDIVGYCDTVGPDGYNDVLSRRRADAVLRYLLEHGPGPVGRYAIVGLGEFSPVVASSGVEDHRASRRVTVNLLERVEAGTVPPDEKPTVISRADQGTRPTKSQSEEQPAVRPTLETKRDDGSR